MDQQPGYAEMVQQPRHGEMMQQPTYVEIMQTKMNGAAERGHWNWSSNIDMVQPKPRYDEMVWQKWMEQYSRDVMEWSSNPGILKWCSQKLVEQTEQGHNGMEKQPGCSGKVQSKMNGAMKKMQWSSNSVKWCCDSSVLSDRLSMVWMEKNGKFNAC